MAIRLPITTTMGHVSRAILFQQMPYIYFGLGRTSPWEGETYAAEHGGLNEDGSEFSAPLPSVETTELDELIGMKRVDTKALVIPDDEGTVVYRDRTWRKISAEEAIQLAAHWVYIEASVYYDELPARAYRQIGVHSMVKLAEGVPENKSILLPEDIVHQGILEVLDQRKVVTRNEDSRDTFSMIIEF